MALGCRKEFKYRYGHESYWLICGNKLTNPDEQVFCEDCIKEVTK